MPELPEVETVCKSLQKVAIFQQIQKVVIRKYSLRWSINPKLGKILANNIIKNIYRRAKYILIECHNPKTKQSGHLIIHLGMSGKIKILLENSLNYMVINKHDHYDILLTNNTILRYNDPRRFGAILWTKDKPLEHQLLINLGLEPFDERFNAKYLLLKAKRVLAPIKQFIMNNKVVVGVGNIYASEALFAAKIHPLTISKNVGLESMEILVTAIRNILTTAILQGGTTIRDFFDPDGNPGYFAQTLKVYDRTNQPCLICGTLISQVKIGQRSTFFCKVCQLIES